jgi:hypothetical protein
MAPRPENPTLAFASPKAWETWLARNHAKSAGIWLRIYKKGSGQRSVTYAEALDGALCYGWIDSQKRPMDEASWLQRFGPRRPRGGWSRINTRHVERLIAAGRMKPAGLAEVEAAKQDGRWERAYDSGRASTVPPGLPRGPGQGQEGAVLLRGAEPCERLRDHVSPPDGQEAGDARETECASSWPCWPAASPSTRSAPPK